MSMELLEEEKEIHVVSATMLIRDKKVITFGTDEDKKYVKLFYIIDANQGLQWNVRRRGFIHIKNRNSS